MKHTDFFLQSDGSTDEISMSDFIGEMMRTDRTFASDKDELTYYRMAIPVIRSERLTCYSYMEAHGILKSYEAYREDTEELPFD